jgi:hypothetical protein
VRIANSVGARANALNLSMEPPHNPAASGGQPFPSASVVICSIGLESR